MYNMNLITLILVFVLLIITLIIYKIIRLMMELLFLEDIVKVRLVELQTEILMVQMV